MQNWGQCPCLAYISVAEVYFTIVWFAPTQALWKDGIAQHTQAASGPCDNKTEDKENIKGADKLSNAKNSEKEENEYKILENKFKAHLGLVDWHNPSNHPLAPETIQNTNSMLLSGF